MIVYVIIILTLYSNQMSEVFGINKQSKLFQKFMNQKNSKQTTQSQQKQGQSSLEPISYANNQNQSSLINRNNRSMTDLAAKNNNLNRSQMVNPKNEEKPKNSMFSNPPMNTKIIANSLNYKNGLGLDEILRRAIEKVRENKIQDLFERKRDSPMANNHTNLKSPQSQNQKIYPQNSSSPQLSPFLQTSQENQTKKFEETVIHEFQQGGSKAELCRKQPNNIQAKGKRIYQATKRIEQLEEQLETLKQRLQSLSSANIKLKSQINKETNLAEKLIKENKDLNLQIRQLESLVSNKESQIKQKSDDSNYWKNQYQIQKTNVENVRISLKRMEQSINRLNLENASLRKEKEDKDNQIITLKIQFQKLNEENTLAKKYLCQLTFKLYHYQKEMCSFRGNDSKNVIQVPSMEIKNQEIVNSPRFQQNQCHLKDNHETQSTKVQRKRQFSRQRHQKNNIIEISANNANKTQQQTELNTNKVSKTQNKVPTENKIGQAKAEAQSFSQSDTLRQFRLATIEQQLKQIKQLAFINGKMRRRKIQLQRQLQQLKF